MREKAQQISTKDIQKYLDIVSMWHNDYHNGTLKTDKETSREQQYNRDFFLTILGYEEKPANPYSFEPKATTDKGQLPDAVIGYTDKSKDIKNITAVVELKGASILLDRPQRREGNMSPIQQGFKYKTQYRNCPFVIVSNFWEFRLYNDTQLDYEIWTLDDLVNPADDYILFKTWFVLLSSDNFVAKQGKSVTENLLSDIRVGQEEIGKKFYKLYKKVRLDLLRDIYKNNHFIKKDIDTGIEKAQKIIDRIVFAAFAEDKNLLPDDTLQKVVRAAEHSAFGGSLWSTFKGFFEAIDGGSDKLDIPSGYNGGLFARDDVLNNLEISDEPLRAVAELGSYNFSEDLSVNILGHIFEQSISDLEEIKNKVKASQNLETLSQSRRKKEGIFYTPDYIVHYIVDNSLGAYLREEEEKLKQEFKLHGDINDKNYQIREKKAYGKYQDFLQNVKIVDPACGSGAFLVHVFEYLLAENKRVNDILGGTLFSSDDYVRHILQNNIYGVDLNDESVEITKLSLWLKSAQKGKKLTALDGNIKCGNSLIDDPEVAGDKAFNWQNEFAEIFKNGGFDVVVGNPPYVRQELFKNQTTYLSQNYESYTGKADLFVYFFELATKIVKENGLFGYISSGKFFEANYGKALLGYLTKNTQFQTVVNFGDLEVFQGVTAYPIVFIAKKSSEMGKFKYVKIHDLDFSSVESVVSKDGATQEMVEFIDNNYKFHDPSVTKVLRTISTGSVKFTDCFPAPTVGIKTGLNSAYQSSEGKPYVFGRDIRKYQPVASNSKIIFPYERAENGYELLPENRIDGIAQLTLHKEHLSSRAIIKEGIKSGAKTWYEYQQINKQLNFEEEFIVYPNVSLGCNFTLSNQNIIDMTGFIIQNNSRYLLALLNSSLFRFFMENVAISRRGGYHEFKAQYITQFPVKKEIPDSEKKMLENKVEDILKLSADLYSTSSRFKQLIKSEFDISKLPVKLNRWWVLDVNEFLVTLRLNLSLQQKDELLQLFEKYKKECVELDTQIQKTDQEIDQLVYKLYKLMPEEIAIVEESTK